VAERPDGVEVAVVRLRGRRVLSWPVVGAVAALPLVVAVAVLTKSEPNLPPPPAAAAVAPTPTADAARVRALIAPDRVLGEDGVMGSLTLDVKLVPDK
jgi:hypothetical protein